MPMYHLPASFFTVALAGLHSRYGLSPFLRMTSRPAFGIWSLLSVSLIRSGVVEDGTDRNLLLNLGKPALPSRNRCQTNRQASAICRSLSGPGPRSGNQSEDHTMTSH